MSSESSFNKLKFQELRQTVGQKLAEILAGNDKRLVSNAEFRRRMREELKKNLEEDDRADELITCARTEPDGSIVDDTANVYANISRETGRKAATKEDFETWYLSAIGEMLSSKIIQPEKISKENARELATIYQQFQSIFYKIKSARMNGDFVFEQQFTNANNESPVPCVAKPESPQQEPLMLSQLIDKFIRTKLADGQWTERNLATHKSRLDPLLDIFGDMPVSDFDRDKARHYRDVLCKLPPNRKKSKEYANKTIDEILRMSPKTALNIKTVNSFTAMLSSMFEEG